VNPLVFGCGPIGARGDAGREESFEALRAAWDGGIRHFDTAPSYGDGAGERLLGDALKKLPRDEVTVSTKVGRVRMAVQNPYAADPGPRREAAFDFHADAVRSSVFGSLSRLGMNRLDTVYVHDPDDHLDVAVSEALPALEQLKAEGVIRQVGVGTTSAATASWLVDLGLVDVVMIANAWSLTRRNAATLLDECAEAEVDVLVAAPFDSGLLARDEPDPGARYLYRPPSGNVLERVRAMAQVCRAHGARLPQAALWFPLRHKAVRQVVAGMRTAAEVRENLAMLAQPVREELWAALDRVR
jgi:D-threo-aldose 1-dehydrogenase